MPALVLRTDTRHSALVLIVRSGVWLYDESVESPVDIVGFDFDWWYQFAVDDGSLEPDEQPQPLGRDGLLYYVRFRRAGDPTTPTWVDSGGHAMVEEAMRTAEANAPSPIKWSA